MTIRPKAFCAMCHRRIYDLASIKKRQYCKGKPCKAMHEQLISIRKNQAK